MRRTISFLLAFVLAASLCTALTGSVMAVEKDISAAVGSEVSLEIDLGMTETPTGVTIVEGQLPPGMELGVADGKVMLTGTPTQAGGYRAVIHVDPADAGEEHILRIQTTGDGTGGPVTTATPETTDAGTEAPTAAPGPKITKHPGAETISENGTAIFVSRAEGAAEIEWALVAPNGTAYTPEDAEDQYSGLIITGQGTETLTLYGVPGDLNGWNVECHFKSTSGAESVSDQAAVNINASMLPAPAISRGPEETFLLFGASTTLAVYATPADGCTIMYQWYQTTTDDPATATPIQDATGTEYVPPETDGTVYYCVGLRNVNSESVSTTAYTPLVAITYGSEPPVPEHVHDFGTAWYHDNVYHWQECECGEIGNHATHSYSWTVTKKPTARKDGERHGVCTVCGFETDQILAAQRSDDSERPRMTTVIALLMLAIALLLFGVYYYTRTTGGRPSAPRRGASNAGRRSAPRQPARRQRNGSQGQWRTGGQWPPQQRQWQDNGQDQWQEEGQNQWQEDGQDQWQTEQDNGQWQDDQGQWQ